MRVADILSVIFKKLKSFQLEQRLRVVTSLDGLVIIVFGFYKKFYSNAWPGVIFRPLRRSQDSRGLGHCCSHLLQLLLTLWTLATQVPCLLLAASFLFFF